MIGVFYSFYFFVFNYSNSNIAAEPRIVIEATGSANRVVTSRDISWSGMDFIGSIRNWHRLEPVVKENRLTWIMKTSRPILLNELQLTGKKSVMALLEPGDSVHLLYEKGKIRYSGIGSEKLKLADEINTAFENEPSLGTKIVRQPSKTLEEFYLRNEILTRKSNILTDHISQYRGKISTYALEYFDALIRSHIEHQRLNLFYATYARKQKLGISAERLCNLYDSIIVTKNVKKLIAYTENVGNAVYLYDYSKVAVDRDLKFDPIEVEKNNQSLDRKFLYYDKARQLFSGEVLENYMVYFLTSVGVKKYFVEPQIEALLSRYYATPGFSEHKKLVRDYELYTLKKNQLPGSKAPNVSFYDIHDKSYSLESFIGKPVMICFYDAYYEKSKQVLPYLKTNLHRFSGSDFLMLFVSINDKEQWKQSINEYSIPAGNILHLYAGDDVAKRALLKGFDMNELPGFVLVDREGKFKSLHITSPFLDNGKSLVELMSNQIALLNDGPYLFHVNDSVRSWRIIQSKAYTDIQSLKVCESGFESGTDLVEVNLPITLKSKLEVEPSEFDRPEKLLVLSDIEGNFDSFRKILQANGVINDRYNWTFGNGHLVFAGDMFDRGDQVTECLWLVYYLEEKAKNSGGYVHFILGNHEIMNLSGDTRYLRPKYNQNATLMKMPYIDLVGESSELGRWLRTKNIIEKIGDLLFAHGGISREVVMLPLTLSELNREARKYYANQNASKISNKSIAVLFGSSSPFWFRGYYRDDEKKTPVALIDSTLARFNVSRIITGHTIFADTVSIHYDGKVINTDTYHKEGKSEALFIDGYDFYRVNMYGDKKRILHK